MKIINLFSLLLLIAFGISCSTSQPDNDQLIGRWKLSKQEESSNKTIDFKNQPTQVILHLQKNGYFVYYDTVVNETWRKTGVPAMQVRSRGQWELQGNTLKLSHSTADTDYVEKLTVHSISDNELITKGSDKKSKVFTTFGK